MIQFDFDKITGDLTSNQMRAMETLSKVIKTSCPILIFGRTGDIRRDIAHQIADNSRFKVFGNTYFDCGVEYGSIPFAAGTMIIDNVDYASKFVQVRLKEYMDADNEKGRKKGRIRFIFLGETNLEEKVETGKLIPGVFFNMVMSINANHVVL